MTKKHHKPTISRTNKVSAGENSKPSPGNNVPVQNDKGLRSSVEYFFSKNLKLFFFISLGLTVIFGIYLFDVKIHEGGDDSSYIEMAYNFLHGKSFPSWHGEFYSILLSLPILLFGINVVVLKLISFLFIIGHLIFFYLAFRNRIYATLLVLTMLIISVSSNILFFSSQTYSEALYMLLQAMGIYIVFRLTDNLKENRLNNLGLWPYWLITGAIIFMLATTRNIGMTFLLALLAFFLFTRRYWAVIYAVAGYYIFTFPFQLYRKYYWHIGESTSAQQLNSIILKNPYNKAAGTENFQSMITRFIENMKIYLSRHFLDSLSLRDASVTTAKLLPALLLVLIFLIGLYFAFKKSRYMLFIGIYLGGALLTTFITLQQSWGQLRMIVIFIPLMILFLSWGIYELSKVRNVKIVYYALLFVLCLVFFKSLGNSIKKAKANQEVLSKNLEGNLYYGFTPDWVNFLKMSAWVGKNIPENARVASRKPSISFIYSKGRDFYGIFRMPLVSGDSLINLINNEHPEVCIFNLNEFNTKHIPALAQMQMRQTSLAFAGQGSNVYGIFDLSGPFGDQFRIAVDQYGIPCYYNTNGFMSEIHKSNEQFYGVLPDSLLADLKKNNVEYVIMANLRMNPNMKTGNIINTVHRYMFYIELKYPQLFTLVHQIGGEDDEPAKLIKINYERYAF